MGIEHVYLEYDPAKPARFDLGVRKLVTGVELTHYAYTDHAGHAPHVDPDPPSTPTPLPHILSFAATRSTVTANTEVYLTATWAINAQHAVTAEVYAGDTLLNLTITSGTAFTHSPATTTTYTLKVTNADGIDERRSVVITVVAAPSVSQHRNLTSLVTMLVTSDFHS